MTAQPNPRVWTDADRAEALENGVQAVIERLEITDETTDRQWLVEEAQRMLSRLLETGSVHPAPAVVSRPRGIRKGKTTTIVTGAVTDAAAPRWGKSRVVVGDHGLTVEPVERPAVPAPQRTIPRITQHAVHAYWCLSLTLTDGGPCNCGRSL